MAFNLVSILWLMSWKYEAPPVLGSSVWWSLNPRNKPASEIPPKVSDEHLGKEVKYNATLHCFHYNILHDRVFIIQFMKQCPPSSPCLQGRPLKNWVFFVHQDRFAQKSGNEDVKFLRAVCPKWMWALIPWPPGARWPKLRQTRCRVSPISQVWDRKTRNQSWWKWGKQEL